MRRAHRIDRNQPDVVRWFEELGFKVLDLSAVGGGCPDLLVSRSGVNVLVEIKDELKPPSARKLNPLQQNFHAEWKGKIWKVENRNDVIRFSESLRP